MANTRNNKSKADNSVDPNTKENDNSNNNSEDNNQDENGYLKEDLENLEENNEGDDEGKKKKRNRVTDDEDSDAEVDVFAGTVEELGTREDGGGVVREGYYVQKNKLGYKVEEILRYGRKKTAWHRLRKVKMSAPQVKRLLESEQVVDSTPYSKIWKEGKEDIECRGIIAVAYESNYDGIDPMEMPLSEVILHEVLQAEPAKVANRVANRHYAKGIRIKTRWLYEGVEVSSWESRTSTTGIQAEGNNAAYNTAWKRARIYLRAVVGERLPGRSVSPSVEQYNVQHVPAQYVSHRRNTPQAGDSREGTPESDGGRYTPLQARKSIE
ncbi:hypothetical protein K4F52_010335 [Lecanicillium sp. MT-2017a]|nr:hypothetical protein K4F52_010335 [Lecanicillium sp. MT-2017a]